MRGFLSRKRGEAEIKFEFRASMLLRFRDLCWRTLSHYFAPIALRTAGATWVPSSSIACSDCAWGSAETLI